MGIIRLYVAGRRAKQYEAFENFRDFIDAKYPGYYEFEIIDLLENPAAANDYGVFVTPTIAMDSQMQSKRVVGNINDHEKIAMLLGL